MRLVSQDHFKWLGAFVFWGLAALVTWRFGGNDRQSLAPGTARSWAEMCVHDPDRDVLRSVEYVQWSEGRDSAPLFLVRFGQLSTGNGHAGPFRTSLYSVATIQSLHVQWFRQTAHEDRDGPASSLRIVPSNAAPSFRPPGTDWSCPLAELIGRSCSVGSQGFWSQDDISVKANLPDLSGLAGIEIQDFAWDVLQDGASALQLRCRRAQFRSYEKYVSLRGHVCIRTPDAILESNQVLWDPQANRFGVEGRYLLTRQERQFTGSGMWFSEQLEPVRQVLARLD